MPGLMVRTRRVCDIKDKVPGIEALTAESLDG